MATASKARLISHVAGYFLNTFFQGVITVQLFEYYMSHSNDGFIIKLPVFALSIFETAHTAVTLYDAYSLLALQNERSSKVNFLGISGCVLAAIIAFIAQCFYAFRIHRFSRRRWLAMVISLLSTIQLVLGTLAGFGSTERHRLSPTNIFRSNNYILLLAWFAAFAVCDIMIAVTMVTLLLKSRTRILATRRLVKRIVCLTIETGVITTGASILCFVLLAVSPHNAYYLAAMLSLTKIYSITLLLQLKNRAKLHELDNVEISFFDDGDSNIGKE